VVSAGAHLVERAVVAVGVLDDGEEVAVRQ